MSRTHRLDSLVVHYEWKNAIRYMIDHLVAERGLSREEAYVLASVAVDLRISEIVDAPNWIVSAFLPESIFE